jgi:hypothetical protein
MNMLLTSRPLAMLWIARQGGFGIVERLIRAVRADIGIVNA